MKTNQLLPIRKQSKHFPLASKPRRTFHKDLQKQAYATLMKMKEANGGKLKRGSIKSLARSYAVRGFGAYISERMFHYRLWREKHCNTAFTVDVPVESFLVNDSNVHLSPLTVPDIQRDSLMEPYNHSTNKGLDTGTEATVNDEHTFIDMSSADTYETINVPTSKNGLNGITKTPIKKNFALVDTTKMLIRKRYSVAQRAFELQGKSVPRNALKTIKNAVELERGLRFNAVECKTTTCYRNDPTLIGNLEPIISQFYIALAKITNPILCEPLICLAEALAKGTQYEHQIRKSNKEHKIINTSYN